MAQKAQCSCTLKSITGLRADDSFVFVSWKRGRKRRGVSNRLAAVQQKLVFDQDFGCVGSLKPKSFMSSPKPLMLSLHKSGGKFGREAVVGTLMVNLGNHIPSDLRAPRSSTESFQMTVSDSPGQRYVVNITMTIHAVAVAATMTKNMLSGLLSSPQGESRIPPTRQQTQRNPQEGIPPTQQAQVHQQGQMGYPVAVEEKIVRQGGGEVGGEQHHGGTYSQHPNQQQQMSASEAHEYERYSPQQGQPQYHAPSQQQQQPPPQQQRAYEPPGRYAPSPSQRPQSNQPAQPHQPPPQHPPQQSHYSSNQRAQQQQRAPSPAYRGGAGFPDGDPPSEPSYPHRGDDQSYSRRAASPVPGGNHYANGRAQSPVPDHYGSRRAASPVPGSNAYGPPPTSQHYQPQSQHQHQQPQQAPSVRRGRDHPPQRYHHEVPEHLLAGSNDSGAPQPRVPSAAVRGVSPSQGQYQPQQPQPSPPRQDVQYSGGGQPQPPPQYQRTAQPPPPSPQQHQQVYQQQPPPQQQHQQPHYQQSPHLQQPPYQPPPQQGPPPQQHYVGRAPSPPPPSQYTQAVAYPTQTSPGAPTNAAWMPPRQQAAGAPLTPAQMAAGYGQGHDEHYAANSGSVQRSSSDLPVDGGGGGGMQIHSQALWELDPEHCDADVLPEHVVMSRAQAQHAQPPVRYQPHPEPAVPQYTTTSPAQPGQPYLEPQHAVAYRSASPVPHQGAYAESQSLIHSNPNAVYAARAQSPKPPPQYVEQQPQQHLHSVPFGGSKLRAASPKPPQAPNPQYRAVSPGPQRPPPLPNDRTYGPALPPVLSMRNNRGRTPVPAAVSATSNSASYINRASTPPPTPRQPWTGGTPSTPSAGTGLYTGNSRMHASAHDMSQLVSQRSGSLSRSFTTQHPIPQSSANNNFPPLPPPTTTQNLRQQFMEPPIQIPGDSTDAEGGSVERTAAHLSGANPSDTVTSDCSEATFFLGAALLAGRQPPAVLSGRSTPDVDQGFKSTSPPPPTDPNAPRQRPGVIAAAEAALAQAVQDSLAYQSKRGLTPLEPHGGVIPDPSSETYPDSHSNGSRDATDSKSRSLLATTWEVVNGIDEGVIPPLD